MRWITKLPKRRLINAADCLGIALGASIPISTTATGMLAVLWILATVPTLKFASMPLELRQPESSLPLLLVGLAIVGAAWASVSASDRFEGLESFLKLAVIPLLAIHFSRTTNGHWVLIAYFLGCGIALAGSALVAIFPHLYWRGSETFPSPFKNPATQSGEFVTCIAVLLYIAIDACRERRLTLAVISLSLSAGFLSIIAFNATARTPLVVGPTLLLLLAFRRFRLRGAMIFIAVTTILGAALLHFSPYLSRRAAGVWNEVQSYRTQHELTSSGERLEFWKKSAAIISRAPLFGHGVGSVTEQMTLVTRGQSGPYATVTHNPHQQTLVVAIQLGLAGAFLLWAMWIVHAAAFFRGGLIAWVGLVVVVQNVVGCLFNSHLFDFTQGWTYVVGVGVVAGMLRQQAKA